MFSNGSSGDKVFYPWSSDISAFLLLQCAAAFPHCLSSGCKVTPARWLVRASAQIGLNLNLISTVSLLHLFLNFGRIPSWKHISALCRDVLMANLKTVLRFLRILAKKNMPKEEKRNKISTFHVQKNLASLKIPTPHHFSYGPSLIQVQPTDVTFWTRWGNSRKKLLVNDKITACVKELCHPIAVSNVE